MEAIATAVATVAVAAIGAYVTLRHKGGDEAAPAVPVTQGQTIDITAAQGLLALLRQEQANHGLCHGAMRDAGVTIPHD